jgi:hypothetical protein
MVALLLMLERVVLAVAEREDLTQLRLMLPLELLELLIQAVVAVGLQMALLAVTAAPASSFSR